MHKELLRNHEERIESDGHNDQRTGFRGIIKVELSAQYFEKVGQFLDANQIPAESRSIRYAIDDVQYCVNEDGWWCLEDEPQKTGWIRCDPPTGMQGMF